MCRVSVPTAGEWTGCTIPKLQASPDPRDLMAKDKIGIICMAFWIFVSVCHFVYIYVFLCTQIQCEVLARVSSVNEHFNCAHHLRQRASRVATVAELCNKPKDMAPFARKDKYWISKDKWNVVQVCSWGGKRDDTCALTSRNKRIADGNWRWHKVSSKVTIKYVMALACQQCGGW